MADIASLLAGLGYNPRQPGQATRRDINQTRRMLESAGISRPDPRRVGGQPAPVGPRVSPVPVVNMLGDPAGSGDDGGAIKGLLGGIGKGFQGIIKAADFARGYGSSGVKEVSDWLSYESGLGDLIAKIPGVDNSTWRDEDRVQDGSWREFLDQGKRGIGFQEVLDENTDMAGGWQRSTLGVVGDVITDPLSYVTLGGASLAKGGNEAANVALNAAVRNGGRKEISSELARNAAKAGVKNTQVDELIANAGTRGAGALTRRQLARTGVAADDLAKLGVTQLNKRMAGVAVKGTNRIANLTEGMKGGSKLWLAGTRPAEFVRRLRISDELSERKLTDIIRTVANDPAKRADAVRAVASINKAKNESYGWLNVKQHVLGKTKLESGRSLGHEFKGMSDEQARQFTHNLEDGVDGLEGQVRKFYDEVHAELTAAGVDVGHVDNYVPHVTTRDARIAAREDIEVRQAIENLRSKEGFQRTRTLGPGSEFLGETLETGSIREINDIMVAKKGIKFFEDDIRDLTAFYLTDAREALQRATLVAELTRLGVAEDAMRPFMQRVDMSADELVELTRLEKQVKAAKDAELVKVGESNLIRRDEIKQARAALRDRRRVLAGEITKIEDHIRDLQRAVTQAEKRVARAESQLTAAKASRDGWLKVVRSERGAARKRALRQLATAEKRVAQLSDEWEQAKTVYQKVMNTYRVPYGPKSPVPGFQAEMDRLMALRNDASVNATSLAAQADELKLSVTPAGEGSLPADVRVARATDDILKATARQGRADQELQSAASVVNFAIADKQVVMQRYTNELDSINLVLSRELGPLKDMPKSAGPRRALQIEMRDHVNMLREVLEMSNDPAADVIARLEADAAIADMAAWKARGEVAKAGPMIAALKDPKFQEHMRLQVRNGFKQIGERHQIPGWLDNLLTVEARMDDPKFFPELSEFLRKGENLWKGYAIMRPGFVVRNFYSSMGNVYLSEGAAGFNSVRRFERFYKMFRKDPQNYLTEATRVFRDPDLVAQMDQALKVVSGSGGGLAPGEIKVGFMHGVSANPLNSDFAPIKAVRGASEFVEHIVRGGHALSVMQRGGTPELALDTINKWHFNYRDITDFDRAMKHIMPFWTFYSRNLALQAQVWARMPEKLNRTYYNVDRNMGYGQEDDELVPGWLQTTGLRLGGDGNRYAQTGLPSIQFQEDLGKFAEPDRLVGDLAPWFKLPVESMTGEQAFSGVPFKDSEETFTRAPSGNYVGEPREAPGWAQIPGIQQVLDGLGVVQQNEGVPTMTDRDQYFAESMLPPLGMSTRLAPTQAGYKERQGSSLLSWLGLASREVTPQMRDAVRKYGA